MDTENYFLYSQYRTVAFVARKNVAKLVHEWGNPCQNTLFFKFSISKMSLVMLAKVQVNS